MQFVQHEGTAERAAELLVRVRQHATKHRVLRVPGAVAEVAEKRSVRSVGARLGYDVHLHARRPTLRRVEPVRDELELLDRVAAVPRLVPGAEIRRHLHPVDVQLEFTHVAAVLDGRGTLRVGAVAGGEQRQRHPVAAGHRQLLHLVGVDVPPEARRQHVDERRLRLDGHRYLQRGGRQLHIDGRRLADEHLNALTRHRGEAFEIGDEGIGPDPSGNAIDALRVGDAFELITRGVVSGCHGDTWQHTSRRVGHGAREHRFLGVPERGYREDCEDAHEPPHTLPSFCGSNELRI